MTTRQEATQHAIQWAKHAETRATANPTALDAAVTMATMWTGIARLLPAVLDDQQLLEQPKPSTRCTSHHHFGPTGRGHVRCDRQHGHRGIHTAAGFEWAPLPQANAAASTSDPGQQRHPDCSSRMCTHPHCGDTCPWRKPHDLVVAPVPGPRAAADDAPPRCPAIRDNERCERAAGHSGIHQGLTCGWRNTDPAPAAVTLNGPATGLCCQQAVARVAEQLLQHARTAAGLTELERRCLEDAADFVRAHQPAAAAPEPEGWCAAKTPHGPHTCTWGVVDPFRCPGYPGSQL
ncbi:hypothetical protein ABH931_006095 [Streptacidiphilus sp. MAP12-33]|uniref:hypothetical protein n=1 Tax=Streptacidiphilus sp. MAP12-33 TaxID=3156266 RepID=UPI0035134888